MKQHQKHRTTNSQKSISDLYTTVDSMIIYFYQFSSLNIYNIEVHAKISKFILWIYQYNVLNIAHQFSYILLSTCNQSRKSKVHCSTCMKNETSCYWLVEKVSRNILNLETVNFTKSTKKMPLNINETIVYMYKRKVY